MDDKKIDWFKFFVHALLGVIFGAFIGFRLWGRSGYALDHSMKPGLIIIGVSALVCGLLAGCLSTTGWDE